MRDRELYQQILGINPPWFVERVELDEEQREVRVHLEHRGPVHCPCCQGEGVRYGSRERKWRHLDTCQYQTLLIAEIPRVKCDEHKTQQVQVPWAEPGSRFTALFERLAISWLKEASISAVSRELRLSWDEVDGIEQRAVRRGLQRREAAMPQQLGIDETSFQKRHEYVTVLHDIERGVVLDVFNDRTQETLENGLKSLGDVALRGIKAVAMDMWRPYIKAVQSVLPESESKIAFDKFHVAKHLGDAVNSVRRQEHKRLSSEGDETLKGTKYLWLKGILDSEQEERLETLKEVAVKTGRAWTLRHFAMDIWRYKKKSWAEKALKIWHGWAMRSRLEPIKKVARMIKKHRQGILNAIVLRVTNAKAEATNSQIQKIKRRACGFRSRSRFRTAILFHLGGLDLYPKTA